MNQAVRVLSPPSEIDRALTSASQGCEDPLNSDSPDDVLQTDTVMDAWDQLFAENDNLLLSSRRSKVDLSSLHPGPVDVLRLWQIYLDHINPLLKVSYIPELQPRVVNAVSQLNDVGESLEALLFGIYCVSIQSLSTEECEATLGAPKEDLLRAYLFGSKQALLNCNITRTADRECLTALLLYLVLLIPAPSWVRRVLIFAQVSIGSTTDPRSVSSVFSVAVRLAQRMGLHSEAANLKHPVLEAEMRRRLWWALVLFDARIGELADNKSTALSPTWDCRRPLNVNDSDLWPRMTDAPAAHSQPTEAIFVVLRSHLGDFIRYADFYLDFNAPAVRSLARYHHRQQDPDSMPRLETVIGDGYLQCCDEKNPLQLFTAWVTRGTIAKYNLLAYYSSCSWTSDPPSEKHRDVAMSYALDILHYDTQIHTSPLTRGYQWLLQFYFPFPAYVHLAQELKRRPFGTLAHQAWDAMAANYNARFDSPSPSNPLFRLLSRIILQAWRPREAAFHSPGEDTTPPVIVASIRRQMALSPSPTESSDCIDGVPLPQPEFPDADQIGSMPGPFGPYQLNDWDLTTTDSMSLSTMAALEGPAADSDVKLDFYQVDWALGGPYGL